jgi:hypothetical protein
MLPAPGPAATGKAGSHGRRDGGPSPAFLRKAAIFLQVVQVASTAGGTILVVHARRPQSVTASPGRRVWVVRVMAGIRASSPQDASVIRRPAAR